MSFKIYNTLSGKKELFRPLEKGRVKMYTCGPTVYDYASIGNMWSYLTADILRRWLQYLGYEVRFIKNITDVGHFTDDESLAVSGEDKLEKASKLEEKTPLEIAQFYTYHYLSDEKKLNILKPHFQPRPTQEIDKILEIIKELIKKGYAYETDDGVYFKVSKFADYGNLSGNTLDQIKAGARVKINENKENPEDFALWKKRVGENAKHSLHWPSPWGKGFPGWHIECSAMVNKYLGDSIDIHTGGEDNIFPHHECEIAQSEIYTGQPFVKYWVHTRHFLIEGKKMSKSLGNVYTISKVSDGRYKSLEEMGFHPLAFRTLKLASHYRSKANFTPKGMQQAQKNWEAINQFYLNIKNYPPFLTDKTEQKKPVKTSINKFKNEFIQALNDDLNTPKALSVVFTLMKQVNEIINNKELFLENASSISKFLETIDQVLAILEPAKFIDKKIPKSIVALAQLRQQARKQKDFNRADKIRQQIEAKGYLINDKNNGFKITQNK